MIRKVFIVNNQYPGGGSLTIVTTTDVARYVDVHNDENLFTPVIIGNLGLEATECEGVWISDLDDRMFNADARGRDDNSARFWAERRCIA